jgi:hypothetical protein
MWWIRDVYPGSEFFHPGSRIRIKEFKYVIQKLFCEDLGKMVWVVPDPDFLPITDPRSRVQKGTGS